jgi:putative membrane protein
MTPPYAPYCGEPPAPTVLLERWNADPLLAVGLAALLWGYGRARSPSRDAATAACYYIGWGVLAAALVSPLCALSVSLFSARVGQHMAIVLVAAPLLALGRPDDTLAALAPRAWRFAQWAGGWTARPLPAAALFAALLWLWHAPAPYAATFDGPLVYWIMHATMTASAVLLWCALLRPTSGDAFGAFIAGAFSLAQMSLLGALLTFAAEPLYAPHLATAWAWSLSPLDDQRLGGLIMWAPGCAAFAVAALLPLGALLRTQPDADTTRKT